ncbi:MAG: hypothetical protein PUB37_04250 [Firmicutes bacterium]|nr:hypothetical protein [Bacillota bacterium]
MDTSVTIVCAEYFLSGKTSVRACLASRHVRTALPDFSPDEAKTAGNTLCINEDFGEIWRKRCKQTAREEIEEILNRL